ncbi:MAG: class I SAM-dependent methyltransferase [Deltaproteobacteria bacterium]|nr:class I SAM-dependent methyltransferase [Deltaproteobacteria bacterium]
MQRQGSRGSTLKGFAAIDCPDEIKRILDIGCGTGAATLVLKDACNATIVAVDNHQPFLDILAQKLASDADATRSTPARTGTWSIPT